MRAPAQLRDEALRLIGREIGKIDRELAPLVQGDMIVGECRPGYSWFDTTEAMIRRLRERMDALEDIAAAMVMARDEDDRDEAVEAALTSALRIVNDRMALMDQMAAAARAAERRLSAAMIDEQRDQYFQQAEAIRSSLL